MNHQLTGSAFSAVGDWSERALGVGDLTVVDGG